MHTIFVGLAAAITLLALIMHVTIGTKENAAPILDDTELPEHPRRTLTFSWKANSVLMLFMAAGFLNGLYVNDLTLVAFNALLAGGLAIASTLVAIKDRVNPFRFPPMPLFLVISTLGLLGVFL